MMQRRRTQFNDVSPGSKLYAIMRLMFRKKGVTSKEVRALGLVPALSGLGTAIIQLEDFFGYDIRIVDQVPGLHHKKLNIYRIVARYNMNGTLMHDYIEETADDA